MIAVMVAPPGAGYLQRTMRQEIRFAGFGGQGIISAGRIAGQGAVIFDGKHAVFTQSYGPEARGGACAAEVIVSDTSVDYPVIGTPDVAVIMSQEAYTTYGRDIRPGGTFCKCSLPAYVRDAGKRSDR